jgi:hypothetical protein
MPGFQIQSKTTNKPASKTFVQATGEMGVILGIQSPYFKQRSIVALLAENTQGFDLLSQALTQGKKRSKISGTVTVIRDGEINSLYVGPQYHLGNLLWWQNFWIALQKHPINLAIMSLLAAILVSFLVWNGLMALSRRRLHEDKK